MSRFDSSKFTRIEHDKKGVIYNYDDAKAFTGGTDISLKTLQEVEKYRGQYAEDAVTCASDLADKVFSKEKDLEKITVRFPFSTYQRGHVDVEIDRTTKSTIPGKQEKLAKVGIRTKVVDPFAKVSKDNVVKVCEAKLQKYIMN